MQAIFESVMMYPDIARDGSALMDMIMERFEGKNSDLKKIESICDDIVKEIVKGVGRGPYSRGLDYQPIHKTHELNKRLEESLAKFFKIKKIDIYWSGGAISTYTKAPSTLLTKINSKRALLEGDGSNMNINVFIHDTVVSSTSMTGGELLAVILHEIGHCFYVCPVYLMFEITSVMSSFGITVLLSGLYKFMYLARGELISFIRKNIPMLWNIIQGLTEARMELKYLILPWNVASKGIFSALDTAIILSQNPTAIVSKLFKYGDEKGADSFAARYGYGPELASALKKMETPKYTLYGEMVNQTGTMGEFINDFTLLTINLTASITLDPHPSTNQRARSVLKKLKDDYRKGDYPPAVKKQLEAQIREMEVTCDNINRLPDATTDEGIHVRQSIYKVIDSITDGHSDLREIFNFYFDACRF